MRPETGQQTLCETLILKFALKMTMGGIGLDIRLSGCSVIGFKFSVSE